MQDRHSLLLGPDCHPRLKTLEGTDDNAISRLQRFLNYTQAVLLQLSEGDSALLELVLGIHDENISRPLFRGDNSIADQKSRMRRPKRHANTREHSGNEPTAAAW